MYDGPLPSVTAIRVPHTCPVKPNRITRLSLLIDRDQMGVLSMNKQNIPNTVWYN